MRKLLALDGGGIKGAFAAAFLAELESQVGRPVGAYFDLVAGTSTGGIIALGLGSGLSAKDILEFYRRYGPKIFSSPHGLGRAAAWIASWFSGKYEATGLRDALSRTFNDKLLGDSKLRLVIPSQNLETGEVHIYKTAHHERFTTDYRIAMVDVALATSAAPTFFPSHKLPSGAAFVDGGLWANNPSGVAAVEALGVLQWNANEVLLLSLSCTRSPLDMSWAAAYSMGKLYWGAKLLDVVSAGQSSGALGAAQHLLGHEKVFRIEPVVAPGRFALDGHKEIEALAGLGATEARKAMPALAPVFDEPAEPFVPLYQVAKEETK